VQIKRFQDAAEWQPKNRLCCLEPRCVMRLKTECVQVMVGMVEIEQKFYFILFRFAALGLWIGSVGFENTP
jgi:hypothetical protein